MLYFFSFDKIVKIVAMKVKVSFWRTFRLWLIAFIIGGVAFFSMFFSFYTEKWHAGQPFTIALYVAAMVLLLIISHLFNYYEVYKKYIVVKKFRKELIYYFSDILYIDQKGSEKSKTITFVTRHGHLRFLPFDKNGVAYKTMIENCHNLLTLQEIKAKFPNIKL